MKNKGVIKDLLIHKRICNEIKNWFIKEKNMNVLDIIQSPLKGPKGNIEFFIIAIK